MLSKILHRIKFPSMFRRFEAAGGGRRWANTPTISNVNAAILASNTTVRDRARPNVFNNGWISNAVNTYVANMIGTGIVPQSQHDVEATRAALQRLFLDWTDYADLSGLTDFYGLQAQVCRASYVDGECFVWMRPIGKGRVPLGLTLVSADQVDASLTRELTGGGRIVAGIEFDANGARVAYHVFKQAPGEAFATSLETVRIPAADMLHVFIPETIGQVRGISRLVSILLRLKEIDGYEDAQLVRQKVSALFAGFITDTDGTVAGLDGQKIGGILDTGLEPGVLKVLPQGADIKFSEPAEVGDVVQFLQLQLRAVAAGMGVTYEQLTGDLTGVNYSSIRSGLLEFRRRIEQIQHAVIVYQMCRPIWQRFVTLAVLSGAMPAPDFEAKRSTYLSAKWITPGWPWIDPESDVKADATAVQAGFKSRSEVIAARGYNAEDVDSEIASDNARAKKLDLTFTAPAPNPPAAARKQGVSDAQ